jgi:hypothetical protein
MIYQDGFTRREALLATMGAVAGIAAPAPAPLEFAARLSEVLGGFEPPKQFVA